MSQGQRIAQDIILIRSALLEQGYRLQKQPRQAVWVIHLTDGTTYRLTYQPAPISAWSLHPPDRNASHLLGLIDRALTRRSIASQSSARTYHQQLHPWCIIRLLPQLQRLVIARFRRRTAAEAHLQVLRRLEPTAHYEIIFDPSLENTEVNHEPANSP